MLIIIYNVIYNEHMPNRINTLCYANEKLYCDNQLSKLDINY